MKGLVRTKRRQVCRRAADCGPYASRGARNSFQCSRHTHPARDRECATNGMTKELPRLTSTRPAPEQECKTNQRENSGRHNRTTAEARTMTNQRSIDSIHPARLCFTTRRLARVGCARPGAPPPRPPPPTSTLPRRSNTDQLSTRAPPSPVCPAGAHSAQPVTDAASPPSTEEEFTRSESRGDEHKQAQPASERAAAPSSSSGPSFNRTLDSEPTDTREANVRTTTMTSSCQLQLQAHS